MAESETPRTDALAKMVPDASSINGKFVFMGQATEYVSAEFARELERELSLQSQKIAAATKLLKRVVGPSFLDNTLQTHIEEFLGTADYSALHESVLVDRIDALQAKVAELERERDYWIGEAKKFNLDCQSAQTLAYKETTRAESLQSQLDQSKRVEQVCYDLHDSLGVRWGDDPYAEIKRLKGLQSQLAAAQEAIERAAELAEGWDYPLLAEDIRAIAAAQSGEAR